MSNEEMEDLALKAEEDQAYDDTDDATAEEILGDIAHQLKRAKSAKHLEAKVELANNIYPLLEQIVKWVDAGFVEVFEILDEEEDAEEEDVVDDDEHQMYIRMVDVLTSCKELVSPDRVSASPELSAKIDALLADLVPVIEEEETVNE